MNIRNERGDITLYPIAIQGVRECYKQPYTDEIGQFLKKYTLPQLTQYEIDNLNSPINC